LQAKAEIGLAMLVEPRVEHLVSSLTGISCCDKFLAPRGVRRGFTQVLLVAAARLLVIMMRVRTTSGRR
jgi:hypothetical protein